MKICCFGSLNLDMVFTVNNFVKPKETIQSKNLSVFSGGKGLNQAMAIKKSGADVIMAGSIGHDGKMLLNECDKHGLNRSQVRTIDSSTGMAVIQVNEQGENCIILYDGANKNNDISFMNHVLDSMEKGDFLVLQNEINDLEYLLNAAKLRGIKIFLNPSPIDETLLKASLQLCDYMILNEVEGEILSLEKDHEKILQSLHMSYPKTMIILTVGEKGVYYHVDGQLRHQEAFRVKAVDTTGAGDAFTGYFIGLLSKGYSIEDTIELAAKAAAISVTRKGASESIPSFDEVNSAEVNGIKRP